MSDKQIRKRPKLNETESNDESSDDNYVTANESLESTDVTSKQDSFHTARDVRIDDDVPPYLFRQKSLYSLPTEADIASQSESVVDQESLAEDQIPFRDNFLTSLESLKGSDITLIPDSFHTAREVPYGGDLVPSLSLQKSSYSLHTVQVLSSISDVTAAEDSQAEDTTARISDQPSKSLANLRSILSATSVQSALLKDEENRPRKSAESPGTRSISSLKSLKRLTIQLPSSEDILMKSDEQKQQQQQRRLSRSIASTTSFNTNLKIGHAFVYMILPPDGGYGWFIVFTSFLVQLIIDGLILSIGVSLPYMAQDMEASSAVIILVSAVQYSFFFLSGPITSALINKFGFRSVAVFGAAGSSICFLIASFSPNLIMLLIFYSVMGGPFMNMAWAPSQLIIGYYFERYRPIANGLSCAGAGAGVVALIEINNLLIPKIGWRNNTRVHAGFLLLALVLCLSFIEVTPSLIGIITKPAESDESPPSSDDEYEYSTFNYEDPAFIEPEDRAVEHVTLEKFNERDVQAYSRHKSPLEKCGEKCCALFCVCCIPRRLFSKKDEDLKDIKHYVIKKDLIEKQDLYYTGPADYKDHDRTARREIIDGQDVEFVETDRPVQAINYSLSMHAVRKSIDEASKHEKLLKKRKRICPIIPVKVKNALRILFNFQLFRKLEFRILFFSAFCFSFAFNIPFLFSKNRAELPVDLSQRIPQLIGTSNFIFRILCGFVAFKYRRCVVYLCGGGILFGGLVVFLSAFFGAHLFWFQTFYAFAFGAVSAFYSTLRTIIYVKYLGLENLTNAFGLVALGMGSGLFFGTTIGGILNQVTKSYFASFIVAGLSIIVSGLLKLLLPLLSARLQRKRKVKFYV